jgi:hypothetical protein
LSLKHFIFLFVAVSNDDYDNEKCVVVGWGDIMGKAA